MNIDKTLRVGLVGPPGTGKSSLAEELSKKLVIPNLKSREITEDILNRDGYDYGSGVQIERFLASSVRQKEILSRTIEQQKPDSFVTDRTVIDLAAYAVCELHQSDVVTLRKILSVCTSESSRYTHLFLCPWKDVPVRVTKKRTLNPWYQYLIYIIEKGILEEWGCKYSILMEDDKDSRLDKVLSILG